MAQREPRVEQAAITALKNTLRFALEATAEKNATYAQLESKAKAEPWFDHAEWENLRKEQLWEELKDRETRESMSESAREANRKKHLTQ